MAVCTAFNSSADNFNLPLVKFRSSASLMGTKCKCAWGTSSPTMLMPQRLQGNACSMALAMGLEKAGSLKGIDLPNQRTDLFQF